MTLKPAVEREAKYLQEKHEQLFEFDSSALTENFHLKFSIQPLLERLL